MPLSHAQPLALTLCLLTASAARADVSATTSHQPAAASGSSSHQQPVESDRPGLIVLRPRVTDVEGPEVDPRALEGLASSLIAGLERYRVVSHEDVVAMVGQAEQAQLLGCADEACLAEIGAAMGAPFLFSSSVGKVGDMHVVSASLIDNARAQTLARRSISVSNHGRIVDAMRAVTLRTFGERAEIEPGMSWFPFGVGALGLGVVALLGGATGTGLALMWSDRAQSSPSVDEYHGYRDMISIANPVAITGYVAAGLLLLAAPVFFLLPSEQVVEAGE